MSRDQVIFDLINLASESVECLIRGVQYGGNEASTPSRYQIRMVADLISSAFGLKSNKDEDD